MDNPRQLTFVVNTGLQYHIELFLKAKQSKRPKTYEWYSNTLRYFGELCPYWPPAPDDIQLFIDSLIERRLSESTIDNYFRALRAFLNWCERLGHLRDNPIQYAERPRRPRLLPKAPRPDNVGRLFTVLRAAPSKWVNVRDLALFCLALDSGARIGELLALELADIDLMNLQLMIYGSKVAQERTAVIGDQAAGDLATWLDHRKKLDIPARLETVFVSNNRGLGWRPLSQAGARFRLRHWQDAAGIRRFRFNAFRHGYAVFSLRNGADLLDIKHQLGHTTIKTTAIYTEVVDDGRLERHRRSSPIGNLTDDSDLG